MSSNKRKFILNTVSVNLGCSSCIKPKLSNIFQPKTTSKTPKYHRHSDVYFSCSTTSSSKTNPSPSSPTELFETPTTFSPPPMETPPADHHTTSTYSTTSKNVQGFGRVGEESVAVEKESDDPYLDFRDSMLQMILENQIYTRDDLRELLNCFLQLNSPYHHGIIVRAFTEIWNGVFSVRSTGAHHQKLHGYGYKKSRDF